MIKLKVNDYGKVVAPLKTVTINTLFAKSVICQQISGSVYVDNDKEPKVFYIVHPYGMSILFGNTESENFNEDLFFYLTNQHKVRNKYEWLQVPNSWRNKVEIILGSYLVKKDPSNKHGVLDTEYVSRVVENTRVNFVFDINKYKE